MFHEEELSWRRREEQEKRGFGLALDTGKRRGRREAEKEDKMGRLRFFKK